MITVSINWETVYVEYEPKVRAYIQSRIGNPEDVKELCSEVFLNVMSKKEQFSGEPKAISSWIYMITKHTVAGFYRSYRANEEIPEELSDDTDIEASLYSAEMLDRLADALEQIDEKLRDVIMLHYFGEKTLKEIAAAKGISYPYAKILHKKALGQLKKLLG